MIDTSRFPCPVRSSRRVCLRPWIRAWLWVSWLWCVSVGQLEAANPVLWQLGQADDSAAEFSDYQPAASEPLTVPADWQTRMTWNLVPKGLRASTNPAWEIRYDLATVPEHGVLFSFKLLNAPKSGPQLAVFSNRLLAGLIQLWGTAETNSPFPWKKTYRLYIPRELLLAGSNVLRLEATRPLWSDASVDARVWWEWDFLRLEALATAPREPVHGAVVYLGTTLKQDEGFNINDDLLRMTPAMLQWFGIAYSGNTLRADFWFDVERAQPRRLEYLRLLRDLNLTVLVDFVSGSHFRLAKDRTLPANIQSAMVDFFRQYGDLFPITSGRLIPRPCLHSLAVTPRPTRSSSISSTSRTRRRPCTSA